MTNSFKVFSFLIVLLLALPMSIQGKIKPKYDMENYQILKCLKTTEPLISNVEYKESLIKPEVSWQQISTKNLSPAAPVKAEAKSCKEMISEAEKKNKIPKGLLSAIAKVESKHSPWAINFGGRGYMFKTKQQALNFLSELERKKARNINIGYMQINTISHAKKFKNMSDILNPSTNINYAAKLLKSLHNRYGSWSEAVRHYHSSNTAHNITYKNKVLKAWGKNDFTI